MSSIVDSYTNPLSSTSNIIGGFDIVGFEDKENKLLGSKNSDFITGGNLNDAIDGGAGFDFINGKEGDDHICGGDNIDFILGGAGDDVISGDGGNDFILGGAGDDVISGDDGDDFILGGAGNDVIKGGAGQNILFGGAGKDIFVLEFLDDDQIDTIQDLQVGEDKIQIRGVGADAQVDYDEITGELSVNEQVVAKLQPGLDISDEDYELF